MKSELAKLVELQKTDTRLRQLKNNIDTAETRRAELEDEFEKHASSIREIQNRLERAKETKSGQEKDIAEAKVGLERAARNLKTAQDTKQYEAAMREIDSLNKQTSNFETKILELMEVIDETSSTLEERADEVANLESDWEKRQTEFEEHLESERAEVEKLTKAREEVFAGLPDRLAAVYDRLVSRSRDGIAVAKVIDDSCSACFMSLRKQVVVELKTTDQIVTCESCTRILYVNEQKEASAVS
ncbi:MAG TPA: C4-type zinc ribbon domain-containing protein [Aridibacter sp.]|nr:C4-type zinc ribbon domain-containing protein [Aridibacter sp.]